MKQFFMTLFLFLCFALPARAAEERFKDYIFRGMPNFKLGEQARNFNELTIMSTKPGSEETEETTYEGNLVFSRYGYAGKEGSRPSPLQIVRSYQEAVKKLGGEILYNHKTDRNNFHGSFTRNDKQYYIRVSVFNGGAMYDVYILELAEMQNDIEILDDDDSETQEDAGTNGLDMPEDMGPSGLEMPEDMGISDSETMVG